MKTINKNSFGFLAIFLLSVLCSCDKEEVLHNLPKSEVNKNVNTNKVDNVKEAIVFLNAHFVPKFDPRAHDRYKGKEMLEDYTKDKISIIYKLNDTEGLPLFKLICFAPSGYVLVSNLENVPNPPVLFYSPDKFDKKSVNPALVRYVEEFTLSHSRVARAPTSDEDQDGDGAWDDGRDTGGTGNPQDSHYYHKETVVSSWTATASSKEPLLSTYWNQNKPYNRSIEKINGEHPAVGCVAIAVGQIMNYKRKNNLKNYNWDRINDPDGKVTNDLTDFLYDIGRGVDMKYGLGGSSAWDKDALAYFKRAGYSSAYMKGYNYDIYKQYIDSNKPVYLTAYSIKKPIKWFGVIWYWKYEEGHAWVGDGYKIISNYQKIKVEKNGESTSYYTKTTSSSKFIHMNWGWGAASQETSTSSQGGGWCTYTYFKSPIVGTTYRYKNKMILY